MDFSRLKRIAEKYNCPLAEGEPLAPYTTFRIGGNCPVLLKPESEECLLELVTACRESDLPFRIIGKGSNLLISDKGVDFPVFLPSMNKIEVRGEEIICGAGASLSSVCLAALEHSLTGLEFAFGIPGSAGGAVFMNAGAYDGEIKDVVSYCRFISKENEILEMAVKDMELTYRGSIFQKNGGIITNIVFKLSKGDRSAIKKKMDLLIKKRKEKQPLEYPSAGSTFKRPPGDFAGRLIQEAGLRGRQVGGAMVSEKHCGFIINYENASFNDAKELIETVKREVYKSSGTRLECEVKIWE